MNVFAGSCSRLFAASIFYCARIEKALAIHPFFQSPQEIQLGKLHNGMYSSEN
ncbi:hypothetical protein ACLBWT_00080 [Paenibacillus sp. D51F]